MLFIFSWPPLLTLHSSSIQPNVIEINVLQMQMMQKLVYGKQAEITTSGKRNQKAWLTVKLVFK